jgi:hypothetical protein
MAVTADPGHPAAVAVRQWLERAVIGLNLCPFAKAVHVRKQIRYAVSDARNVLGGIEAGAKDLHADAQAAIGIVARDLEAEMRLLAEADPRRIDTTLLILPDALADFSDYNDFLDTADRMVQRLRLRGVLQVASFHPHYQFAGSDPDDIENYTNRSPYPILHLLREASIDTAVEAFPDAADIYERNQATMQQLGLEGWRRLFADDARE